MVSIYESEGWKKLCTLDRAQLLLVLEGLKRGTIIEGSWTYTLPVLSRYALDYYIMDNTYSLLPTMAIGRKEHLSELILTFLSPEETEEAEKELHRSYGHFLGYPDCCIEKYVAPMRREEIQAMKSGKRHLAYRFGEELTTRILNEGTYPDVFDYRPPSFTPCSINCKESLELLAMWKNAILEIDPEAAEELVFFTRSAYPECLVHRDYLRRRCEQNIVQVRLDELRRTISK